MKRLLPCLLLAAILAGCGASEQPADLPPRPNPYDETQREAYAEWVELRDERREQPDDAPLWVKSPGSLVLFFFLLLPITGPVALLLGWLAIRSARRRPRAP